VEAGGEESTGCRVGPQKDPRMRGGGKKPLLRSTVFGWGGFLGQRRGSEEEGKE